MPLPNPAPNQPIGSSVESLALLYQGVLTVIVRLQSGRQHLGDINSFSRLMENLFKEIKKEALKLGYSERDVEDGNFAVAALLDETVQGLDEAGREQWSPLQAKMFPQNAAGEPVWERLAGIRRRSESTDLADLLEVYYLCFLLGYEGKHAGDRRRPENLLEELRQQIEGIRGRRPALSPEVNLPRIAAAPPPPPAKPPATAIKVAAACVAAAGASWMVLRWLLDSAGRKIVQEMTLR